MGEHRKDTLHLHGWVCDLGDEAEEENEQTDELEHDRRQPRDHLQRYLAHEKQPPPLGPP